MIKGWLKYINKVMGFFITLSMFIGMFTTSVYAASFSLTSNRTSVTPNGGFTVTISADGAGKFDIVASNATISSSSVWCDGSCTITATAGSEGTATITVKAVDAYDWNEKPITGSKEIKIKVVKATDQNSNTANTKSALSIQLAIAEKLNRNTYTDESWQVLMDAIKDAKIALKSNSESKMKKAAEDLKLAIDSLVVIDHSKLQNAINQAYSILKSENAELWKELALVLNENEGMLSSTSQQEVDVAADKILEVLNRINAQLIAQDDDIVIKGGDKFCNMPLHTVWTILFFISFAINITIGYMLVNNSKRRFNDDIPVVDYDINDDNI